MKFGLCVPEFEASGDIKRLTDLAGGIIEPWKSWRNCSGEFAKDQRIYGEQVLHSG
jgi:hypothetical protein